jgi:hypothetical protein
MAQIALQLESRDGSLVKLWSEQFVSILAHRLRFIHGCVRVAKERVGRGGDAGRADPHARVNEDVCPINPKRRPQGRQHPVRN